MTSYVGQSAADTRAADATTIRKAGEALYGDAWQSPMARLLGVSLPQLRSWVADGAGDVRRSVPRSRRSAVYRTLGAELRQRRRDVCAAYDTLEVELDE